MSDGEGGALTAPNPRAVAVALLDPREKAALEVFERGRMPTIAEATADRMFQLYLRGLSCEDIRVLNPGFGLGPIVDARVRGGWDARRSEYDVHQITDGADAIRRAQLDAASLAADYIAVTVKLHRTRMHRYLQTGDEKELEGVPVGSIDALRKAVEILMKATRQEGPAMPRRGGSEDTGPGPTATVISAVGPGKRVLEVAVAKKAARNAERAELTAARPPRPAKDE